LQHGLLFGVVAVGLVVFIARWAMNGGNLPLAGRYASVGTSHASPLRVFELFLQHLGELDFAVGVIPFACALLATRSYLRLSARVSFCRGRGRHAFWLCPGRHDAAASTRSGTSAT
jgi:hypothetical protein